MRLRFFLFFFSFLSFSFQAQNNKTTGDEDLKQSIYNSKKKEVLNYSLKDFDQLFFEFTRKKAQPDLLLTKEEFYTYTVKIALFSDRLKALYPAETKVAEENKKKWLSENYQDYLIYKQKQKK